MELSAVKSFRDPYQDEIKMKFGGADHSMQIIGCNIL